MEENGIAKKKTTWKRPDGSTILGATMPSGKSASFDLSRIWPEFLKGTLVQMGLQEYGVKQFLSDKTAFKSDEKPSDATIAQTWIDRFEGLVDGKLRVNAQRTDMVKVEKSKMVAVKDYDTLIMMRDVLGLPLTPEQKDIIALEEGEMEEVD